MNDRHDVPGDEPHEGSGLPLLYNLAYCSKAAVGVDDLAVSKIIETSQRNNPRRGITGILVFGGGIFFQWLEGPRENVIRLMSALSTDVRHESIVRLSESEEVRERVFPDWDMELVSGGDIHAVLTDAIDETEDDQSAAALRGLLEHLEAGQSGTVGT